MIKIPQHKWKKRNKLLVNIVLWLSTLFVSGCDRLFARTYVEHPASVQFKHSTVSLTTEGHIRRRVSAYLEDNASIQPDVKSALLELKIHKGMSQEQVKVIVGEPSKRKILRDKVEVWTYDRDVSGEAFREAEFPTSWYYGWAKLKFQNGALVDIAVRQIEWRIDL